jgi:N-dimethylarginine dimethylaminohydrolase
LERRKFLESALKAGALLPLAFATGTLSSCGSKENKNYRKDYFDEGLLKQYMTLSKGDPVPRFVMCSPQDIASNQYHFLSMRENKARLVEEWRVLKQVIEGLGADVIELDADKDAGYGEVWTRDPALIFPKKNLFITSSNFRNNEDEEKRRKLSAEAENISIILRKNGLKKIDIEEPMIDGGDVLIDEERGIVFLGYHHGNTELMESTKRAIEGNTGYEVFPIRRNIVKDQANYLASKQTRMQSSVFYHLDCGMAKLPRGKYLISESMVDEQTLDRLQNYLSDDLIISKDKLDTIYGKSSERGSYVPPPDFKSRLERADDVFQMAFNLISIGDTLIMPFCSESLDKDLQKAGFKVVTPQKLGLDMKWKFGDGSVHCATNRLSEVSGKQVDGPIYGVLSPLTQTWQSRLQTPSSGRALS